MTWLAIQHKFNANLIDYKYIMNNFYSIRPHNLFDLTTFLKHTIHFRINSQSIRPQQVLSFPLSPLIIWILTYNGYSPIVQFAKFKVTLFHSSWHTLWNSINLTIFTSKNPNSSTQSISQQLQPHTLDDNEQHTVYQDIIHTQVKWTATYPVAPRHLTNFQSFNPTDCNSSTGPLQLLQQSLSIWPQLHRSTKSLSRLHTSPRLNPSVDWTNIHSTNSPELLK